MIITIIITINFYSPKRKSKRIELSGAPSIGVGQTPSQGKMQNSPINDRIQWKLRRDSKSENVSFQMVTERSDACYLMT